MLNIFASPSAKRAREEPTYTNLDVTKSIKPPIAVLTKVLNTNIENFSPARTHSYLDGAFPPNFTAPEGTHASIASKNTILLQWPNTLEKPSASPHSPLLHQHGR